MGNRVGAAVFVLAGCGSRTGLDVTPAASDAGAAISSVEPCAGPCRITFASNPDWESFAGTTTAAGPSSVPGRDLGPATDVCLNAAVPGNCPLDENGLVLYGYGQNVGWNAGATLPFEAHWIWRADVSANGLADLQSAVFAKAFELGPNPAGTITIGADDLAEVFVNGTLIGRIGSISDVGPGIFSQNTATTFDFGATLRAGANVIEIVAENGPSSFAPGCAPSGCTYAQNPAGVIFIGNLASE